MISYGEILSRGLGSRGGRVEQRDLAGLFLGWLQPSILERIWSGVAAAATRGGSRVQGASGRTGAYAMQVTQGAALLALALCAVFSLVLGTEGKRKLQIGVKKRVDNCPIKSRKGDVLHMHYTGKLEDGTEFDSSLTRDQPFIFSLGTGQVIKGWDQGLLGMCEGEKRKLVIPSELGYGDRGAPPKIPGGATLIFEVELLKIERRQEF
ncbi:peptidyl-prolyl cis-trans isomerase FKBP2-like isoform X2 [Podarcis raffonei]|uniref:peptidyl-prolyl cis-trans isomerase FKBP2-like isoform X2 n=1 Tax=Podarcis raffonei TaxID=65483 RepID=UPI0023298A22|nr:peptidyl-prolyl cis-trans isomerase FKBP2-like isoform X2 [Podarcis raffonei]